MGKNKVLYIDTNVILDAILDRKNLFGKDIGTPATMVFSRAIQCEFHLAISSWTLKELYGKINTNDLTMFFALLKVKTITVKYTNEEYEKACQMSEEHPDDALHIILAEKIKAEIIVTRNTEHFNSMNSEIPIKKPENI